MENLKPSWLDEEFLEQVLKSVEDVNEEQHISISRWQCNNAVPPGTNYLSLLYRLRVEYKIENNTRFEIFSVVSEIPLRSISLIVKTPLEGGQVKEFMDKIDGYSRELKMYREVLPEMYQIADNSVTVTARSYVCPLHNSLVLEDLRELGYKMADRLKQLDAAHCREFLISLAKFHGLSVALYQKDPQLIESVGKSLFYDENDTEEDRKHFEYFTKFNLTAMSKTVESLGFERYAEIIRGKADSLYKTLRKLFKPSGELRVLNHGDCWTNNALFKYNDSDQVVDAKLVDFQMIQVGTFAPDVIQFWWTSARPEVRENLQEEMFEVYRKTLNQTLEQVQMSERVSKEEFDTEMRRFSPYALYICSNHLSVVMADPGDLLDYNDMTKDEFGKPVTEDSHTSKNFRSKYYKAILPDLLRQLERFGVLT